MLNLRPYSKKDPLLLHKEIIDSKRAPDTVSLVQAVEDQVEEQFIVHANESTVNSLENIIGLELNEDTKAALRSLYSSRSKKLIEVKNSITTTSSGRANNLCQYCTINTVGPMDHIMPKGDFPEFSVHAENLFPCCAECNSYKSNTWLIDGSRQFLNLYLDTLPNHQYLFVELTNSGGVIETDFTLDNRNEIDDQLFRLIFSHYNHLNLMERFKKSSHSVVSELRSLIVPLRQSMDNEEIRTALTDAIYKKMEYFGTNYWKSVLEMALVQDQDFMNSCRD